MPSIGVFFVVFVPDEHGDEAEETSEVDGDDGLEEAVLEVDGEVTDDANEKRGYVNRHASFNDPSLQLNINGDSSIRIAFHISHTLIRHHILGQILGSLKCY